MNQNNYEWLNEQIKYAGFGEGYAQELRDKIEAKQPNFQLDFAHRYGDDDFNAKLNFTQSKANDELYYFNSYDATLQKAGKDEPMKQSFQIRNTGENITPKEAYNLMEGRAVNKNLIRKPTEEEQKVLDADPHKLKELLGYNAWVQLDFKQSLENGNYRLRQMGDNYGFNLEEALSRQGIKQLDSPYSKADLLENMKSGNRVAVTFVKDGVESKGFVEPNAQFKTVNAYDESMKRIFQRQGKSETQNAGQQTTAKHSNREQQGADDGPSMPQKKQNHKRKSRSV